MSLKPTDLTVPIIPVHYIADLFSQCISEVLAKALASGSSDPALGEVASAILYFNRLKQAADKNDGLLPAAENDLALDKLLSSWRILREFGFLN